MSDNLTVDAMALREDIKDKYRAVAADPSGTFHFHTGRPLAKRLGYDDSVVGRCHSPISPTECRWSLRPSPISISGHPELLVACRVQAGGR